MFNYFRRFWTRNRPGDTVLERSEEGMAMAASRNDQMHREEFEHERSEEMNMPGLGFEGGLLEQLQQQQQQQEEETFKRQEGSDIPGLEFSNEDEESRRRRVCHSFFFLFYFKFKIYFDLF